MLAFLAISYRFIRVIVRSLGDPEFRGLFVLVLVMLATGSIFYWRVEGWSLFNSLYFSVITLTTVGYGDFSPHTVLGKAFTMVYILVGIGILLGFIDTVSSRSRDDVSGLHMRFGSRRNERTYEEVSADSSNAPTGGEQRDEA